MNMGEINNLNRINRDGSNDCPEITRTGNDLIKIRTEF